MRFSAPTGFEDGTTAGRQRLDGVSAENPIQDSDQGLWRLRPLTCGDPPAVDMSTLTKTFPASDSQRGVTPAT